ncbi:hypothetical protein GOP47_0027055, partial [Adiantum capillus-veneris]
RNSISSIAWPRESFDHAKKFVGGSDRSALSIERLCSKNGALCGVQPVAPLGLTLKTSHSTFSVHCLLSLSLSLSHSLSELNGTAWSPSVSHARAQTEDFSVAA